MTDFSPRTKQMAYVEYIEETSFGSGIPINAVMNWFNSISKFDPTSKIKTKTDLTLGDSTCTTPSMHYTHTKVGEEVGCDINSNVQSGLLQPTLKYFLGGTNALPLQLSDDLATVAMAQIDTKGTGKVVHVYEGMIGTEATLAVPEFGAVTLATKWTGKNYNPVTLATYEGATMLNIAGAETHGSHAVDTGARGLQAEDVNKVYMRLSEATPTEWADACMIVDAAKEMEMKISNKVGLPTDLNETTTTRIKGKVLNSREITFGLTLTYADISAEAVENGFTLENIRNLTPFDFQFQLDGNKYTLCGVRFPELKTSYGGDDMIGDKVTSLSVTGFKENGAAVPPLKVETVA